MKEIISKSNIPTSVSGWVPNTTLKKTPNILKELRIFFSEKLNLVCLFILEDIIYIAM